MSTAEGIIVFAPEPADMQRDVEVQHGPCDSKAVYDHGHLYDVHGDLDNLHYHHPDDLHEDFRNKVKYERCLLSCLFFFICHALGELFLEICFVFRFVPCLEVTTPGLLEPRNNRTEKFFAFLAKTLAKLWVTTLVALALQWVLFRPIVVEPYLGTSVIHAFHLQQANAAMAATPHLRFNLTGYLLFKSPYDYYNIYYDNLAVSVLYAGEKLGPVDDELPSFKQVPHGRTVSRFVLVGQLRNASSTVSEMLSGDRDKGLLELVVRICVMLAFKSCWPFKEEYFTMYDCPLSSPLAQAGEPALSSPAWCKTHYI